MVLTSFVSFQRGIHNSGIHWSEDEGPGHDENRTKRNRFVIEGKQKAIPDIPNSLFFYMEGNRKYPKVCVEKARGIVNDLISTPNTKVPE
ncbi:hypothetical protein TNCT_421701 [Trichonephila clavata]|uniref:Uncharacterized protein n=1 Tax=Trichonephila clavata TaxID=2740835 RepID=A0A8X6KC24_TRICU|nr:hypothetical protein TNCT_421701 [Trichonephila clavata]